MRFDLPTALTIGDTTYAIRSDYRAILDICIVLNDPDLTEQERSLAALDIFYPDFDAMPPEHYRDAVRQCFWFINGGEDESEQPRSAKLMDWEQDFRYIVAPVNRVLGHEIRAQDYLHWWTFLSAYYEIGDCTFAQIVRIRDRLARGKPLEKADRDWYRQNRTLVDFKTSYTEAEDELLKKWGGA